MTPFEPPAHAFARFAASGPAGKIDGVWCPVCGLVPKGWGGYVKPCVPSDFDPFEVLLKAIA